MKNIKSTILGMAVVLLGLTACQSEESNPNPGSETKVQIKTSSTQTRTVMTGDRVSGEFKTLWEVGDALGVYAGSNRNRKFTIAENGINGEVATFSGTLSGVSGETTVYAYYPYDTSGGSLNAVQGHLPVWQTMTRNSHDPLTDIMVAMPQSVNISGDDVTLEDFRFRYLVSFINLSMELSTGPDQHPMTVYPTDRVLSVTLEVAGKGLTGAYTLDLEEGTFASGSATANTVSVYVPANTTVADLSAWMVTKPFEITSSDTMTVTINTERQEIVKTITNTAIDFAAGRVKTLNMIVNDQCTIMPNEPPLANPDPEKLYISGTGTEYGDAIEDAKQMRKLSEGVFEIYCTLTAGDTFRLTDNNFGAYITYGSVNGMISNVGPYGWFDTPADSHQYRVTADFNTREVTFTCIGAVVFDREAYRADNAVMDYAGNGRWLVENHQFTNDQDERYHFRVSHYINGDPVGDGGHWHEKWGSRNRDNQVPGVNEPAQYWDVITYRSEEDFYESNPGEKDWDYCFKLRSRSPGTADILLDMNAATESHTLTYK